MSSPIARWLRRASILSPLAALAFFACAKGETLNGSGSSGSSAGGSGGQTTGVGGSGGSGARDAGKGDSGGSPGSLGGPCGPDDSCAEGLMCVAIGNDKICTTSCTPSCAPSMYCALLNGKPTCVPNDDTQCDKCNQDSDCKGVSEACLTAPLGDSFCARDCTTLGDCPSGFECVARDGYPPSDVDGGANDGGANDGGASDAGSGGSGSGGGTTDAGAGKPTKFCVPTGDASCPCDSKRDGVSRVCSITTSSGVCTGAETCDGSKGAFEGCDAKMPSPEVCNGKDDDCNSLVDDGDPNKLCASEGPQPPHANWACTGGKCQLGACDAGWTNFPPGPPSAGCPCERDMTEPNEKCSMLTNLGKVDSAGGNITIQGTLSSATDVDVYEVDTVDTVGTASNDYHVAIAFSSPSPNNEFVMDVERADTCVDAPSGQSTNIVSYDWCVNGNDTSSPPNGEGTCGQVMGENQCTDHSSKYFIRVYRKSGATATCSQYQISVTAAAGACANFTDTCM